MLLRPGLDREGLFVAGQASQVEQHGHLVAAVQRLRRQEHAELHGQADGARGVTVKALHAAKTGVLGQQFQRAHGLAFRD